jgi:hypothetical protein
MSRQITLEKPNLGRLRADSTYAQRRMCLREGQRRISAEMNPGKAQPSIACELEGGNRRGIVFPSPCEDRIAMRRRWQLPQGRAEGRLPVALEEKAERMKHLLVEKLGSHLEEPCVMWRHHS